MAYNLYIGCRLTADKGGNMKRFMIGQFERFDIKKQNRDFRDNFFGI